MAATYNMPNQLTGTADWSGGWLHGRTGKPLGTLSSMVANGDTVTVIERVWEGPSKYVAVKAGETWAFSAEVRGNDCGRIWPIVPLNSATENGHAKADCTKVSGVSANPPTDKWQVVSCIWKMTSDGYICPRVECGADTGTMQVRHYMLTKGTALPAYAPANGETLVASAVSATPTNILAPKADSATGTRWQVDGTGEAVTDNAIVHAGVSVETPTAGGANVYVRYADSTGHANAVRAATRAFSAGEVARLCGDATLPAGMTPAGIVCTSALTDIVWSAPSLSIGGAVPLASSAHTPYATQDHVMATYATQASLKVTDDSIRSLVKGESTYTDPDGKSAPSGIYSLVTQTMDSVTTLFGQYTKTEDLAATDAVKDAKKAGTDAQAAASAAQSTADSAKSTAQTAASDAATAKTNAASAVSTANSASTSAANAVKTANAASSSATSAVETANAASDTASTASATASKASTDAAAAVKTANTANNNASTAVSTAQTAASDAATAKTNASSAVSTANGAASSAANAVKTANAASSTASSASSTANSAASTANSAKSTADAAKASAASAVSTANSASSTANTAKSTADSLATMIREDATGITVGKSADGQTYSTGRTHMTDSAFEVLTKAGEVASSFGEKLIELGKNSRDAIIDMLGGLVTIKATSTSTGDGAWCEISTDELISVQGYHSSRIAAGYKNEAGFLQQGVAEVIVDGGEGDGGVTMFVRARHSEDDIEENSFAMSPTEYTLNHPEYLAAALLGTGGGGTGATHWQEGVPVTSDLDTCGPGIFTYDISTTSRPTDWGTCVCIRAASGDWLFEFALPTLGDPHWRRNINGAGWTSWRVITSQ